jgi:hypothetical protein
MLAIDCPCGHRLEAPDQEALFEVARAHMEQHHPDSEGTDGQIRARIEADAYEPATA